MKNNRKLSIILLVFVLYFSGCGTNNLLSRNNQIPPLAGVRMEKNTEIERNYADTHCVKFLTVDKNIGLLCSSSSKEFMKDFGVIEDGTWDEISSHGLQLKIATGMAIYDMKPIYMVGRTVYVAETDCDEFNGPIYRATSTCHVGFMPLNNSAFVYGSFVIINHVDSSNGIATRDIEDFWRRLNIPINFNINPVTQ